MYPQAVACPNPGIAAADERLREFGVSVFMDIFWPFHVCTVGPPDQKALSGFQGEARVLTAPRSVRYHERFALHLDARVLNAAVEFRFTGVVRERSSVHAGGGDHAYPVPSNTFGWLLRVLTLLRSSAGERHPWVYMSAKFRETPWNAYPEQDCEDN